MIIRLRHPNDHSVRACSAVRPNHPHNQGTCTSPALQPLLTPAIVGAEIARLCQDIGDQDEHRVYELTGRGLHALA
ncbi:hypothetical protein FNV65_40680 [Streptomyces sp. S1A1-8]|nr:hypothetical protein FNV65_40680 [Streptomyces sp. S1A1-8]QDO33559.1 hypothetical protein FNV63_40705 [Streptomyces sp. S1A1-3]